MRYHVYYCAGSCNDGDHAQGLCSFPTRAEADAFVRDCQGQYGSIGLTTTLIEGYVVED